MANWDLIATAAFGLEKPVAHELERLGYPAEVLENGRVLFHGDERAIARANLWLRIADRVLVRVGTFAAPDFGVLFDQTYALPWEEWLPPDAAFPVQGRSLKSQLSSVPACQKIVKKAIVEKLKAAHGVETLDETGPQFSIEVALLKDQATLTLDTSGPGLHKRGYRTLTGKAQLKETLAAALVQLSYWNPERPLIDPFCGTGTIPIEAALIGRNLAPGRNRSFAAENWPTLPPEIWEAAREEARAAALPSLPLRIIGTDIDEGALSLARYHAEQAGVAEDVHFQQKAFADLTSKKSYGCLITNPPYGERMGEQREVEALYQLMPRVLRRLPTWSHYILTAHPEFEALVGQPADRRRKLYNARIECTYFQFQGPKPPPRRLRETGEPRLDEAEEQPTTDVLPTASLTAQADEALNLPASAANPANPRPPIEAPQQAAQPIATEPAQSTEYSTGESHEEPTARPATPKSASTEPTAPRPRPLASRKPAFGGLSAKALEQAEIFRSRLTKRARHLRKWPARGVTCYRLYDRDVPEIPLVVDRYEDYLHLAEYERPHDRTAAEHADWLDLMVRTAGEALDVPADHIFLKYRQRQKGVAQYERVASEQKLIVAQEGGLKFQLNLSDYLDTGLFLDHRLTRQMVREAAADKRFLNLFAYTGSFTVYAAAGGAKATTTVDLSNTYLDWAATNLRLNHLSGPQHRLVRDDTMEFLYQHPVGPHYDLAVVDPPTFSNSKTTETVWDVQRDHVPLLSRLFKLMAPGGVVFFSTNSRRFKLAESEFPDVTIREISHKTVPEDFRNQRIHRCWRIVCEPPPSKTGAGQGG